LGFPIRLPALFCEAVSVPAYIEKVAGLLGDRYTFWQRLSAADFLSDAEKRELAGIDHEGCAA